MSSFREKCKRFIRKVVCGGKKKQEVSLAASSTRIPPNDLSTTGREHAQQGKSGDNIASTSSAHHHEPPTEQSLWEQAYDALSKRMPRLVKQYEKLLETEEQEANSTPNETTPSQFLSSHGLDTRSDLSRRQVQLNTVIQKGLQRMENHKSGLVDHIEQAANFLQCCSDWIGTAVKISPEASLAWSAVCLILPLFTNPKMAAETNLDGFIYVTRRLCRYVALEPMLRQLGQNARVNEGLVSAATTNIVDLYQTILEFQLSSVLRFHKNRVKLYLSDIVPLKDWGQTRLDIEKLEAAVNTDIKQINELVLRMELEDLNKTSKTEQQQKILAEQRTCLQLFCLTRNATDVMYNQYKEDVSERLQGTCEWFLQHQKFWDWLLQESGPLLVSADPGCGKSVLAKYLIDHELAKQSATICYFFFKDQDQNTSRQAICALLHQLLSRKTALIEHAMEHYNKMGSALIQSEPSLWTILTDAVCDPRTGPVIFVIDALDECAESQLRIFMRYLKNTFRDLQLANAKFKVLMTSRPYQQIVSQFNSLRADNQRIHVPGEEEFETISQEINRVIHHRVEELAENHQLLDEIKSSLERKLLAIGHRTYLWVFLVFDYLEEKGFKRTDEGIDDVINTLPKSVNEAYDKILNRSQDDGTVKIVKNALSIILAARRPLTLSEMNIAMNLGGTGRGRSVYDLKLEQDVDFKPRLRALCGLFVNVHHDKIYLLHQTAREFLILSLASTPVSSNLRWHHSITTHHAHSVLAEICMLYLNMLNSTPAEKFRQRDQHGALLQYSVEHWGDHWHRAGFAQGSAMVDLALELCTPDLTSHSKWASVIFSQYHIRSEFSTDVLVASHLGLAPVTELILRKGTDIEAKDSYGRTALMLAARFGHGDVTQLLLGKSADVEARDDSGWTALMHAARFNHEAVTRQLLVIGANVEARDDDGCTALMYAARLGQGPAVTRLLLENGADVETRDNKGHTALKHAPQTTQRVLFKYGAQL